MKIENRFTVPVSVDEAWRVLLDVERVAPCMPGATLETVDGDEFTGRVKVKVGPISLTYLGVARFVSKDAQAHVVVIEGSGKETRGSGSATLVATCRLVDRGQATEVEVDSELAITGKPAQFGRAVIADVSGKIVDQFATALAREIESGQSQRSTPSSGQQGAGNSAADRMHLADRAAPARPRAQRPSAEAIDLLGTAGLPLAKRVVPLVLGLALAVWLFRRRDR